MRPDVPLRGQIWDVCGHMRPDDLLALNQLQVTGQAKADGAGRSATWTKHPAQS